MTVDKLDKSRKIRKLRLIYLITYYIFIFYSFFTIYTIYQNLLPKINLCIKFAYAILKLQTKINTLSPSRYADPHSRGARKSALNARKSPNGQ